MSTNERHPRDDSTEANSYTVHHLTEADAERAVERFNDRAECVEAGEDASILSGELHIEEALLDEVGGATFLVDGQPLGEYLGYSPPPLLERLIEDAQKIHKQRPILQETLDTATQPRTVA